ncbi:MAG: hypothetical protein PHV55_02245 [Candidatus Omnitrophica bacterium]|nr:hypothetical protein [Candidatus Omnitrophota bacterium]
MSRKHIFGYDYEDYFQWVEPLYAFLYHRRQLVIAWCIVLLTIGIIVTFGFQKYYVFSQGGTTVLHKEYTEEGFYSLNLGDRYIFDRQPVLRISISVLILGGFLFYSLKSKKMRKHTKHHIKKIVLADGLTIEVERPYPGHPELMVEKIDEEGNIKIKGLRGFRDAQTPFVKGLTRKQKERFQKELARLEEERKEYGQ